MQREKNQLKIGVILNYLNMGIGSLIPIFYTPIMLQLLGQSEYGLYKLASSVTSYLGLISMGLGSAVSRYLIKARTEEGKDAEEKTLGLFMAIFQIIALVSFVVGVILTLCLGTWYGNSLSGTELAKMKIIVFIMVCNAALGFQVSPYMSVVSTHERYLFMQIMNIISTCAIPIVNLIVLFFGFASIGMAVSSLVLNLIIRWVYIFYIRKCLEIKPQYRGMPTKILKEILIFSFWIFVANIVGQLYNATDTIMIGAIPKLGTTGVAVYNVGATFSSLVLTLTIGVSSLLTPKTTALVFSGASNTELTDLAIRVGRIQGYIVTLIVTGFIAFGRQFIQLYAGKEYTDAYWVAVLMMVHSMIPLVQSICLNIIIAQNKHKFRSLTYLGIAIINVIGTWFLMQTSLGVIGAALMTCIAGVVGTWFVMNWYYDKVIHLEMVRFWKDVGKLYIIPTILCAITLIISKWVNFFSVPIMCVGIIIFTILYCILSWKFVMNDYEKELIAGSILRIIKRKHRVE